MATNPTANYSFGKPTVGGSTDVWGTELNTALDDIDTEIKTREDEIDATEIVANAALPKAGGVMTGRIDEFTGTVQFKNLTGVITAQDLDMSLANYFRLALTGDVVLSFSGVPATATAVVVLIVDIVGTASYAVTWPDSVTKWAGGAAPTRNAHDVFLLISVDGGTNWQGSVLQLNLS